MSRSAAEHETPVAADSAKDLKKRDEGNLLKECVMYNLTHMGICHTNCCCFCCSTRLGAMVWGGIEVALSFVFFFVLVSSASDYTTKETDYRSFAKSYRAQMTTSAETPHFAAAWISSYRKKLVKSDPEVKANVTRILLREVLQDDIDPFLTVWINGNFYFDLVAILLIMLQMSVSSSMVIGVKKSRMNIASTWLKVTVVRNFALVLGACFVLHYKSSWATAAAVPYFKALLLGVDADRMDLHLKTELLVLSHGLQALAEDRDDSRFAGALAATEAGWRRPTSSSSSSARYDQRTAEAVADALTSGRRLPDTPRHLSDHLVRAVVRYRAETDQDGFAVLAARLVALRAGFLNVSGETFGGGGGGRGGAVGRGVWLEYERRKRVLVHAVLRSVVSHMSSNENVSRPLCRPLLESTVAANEGDLQLVSFFGLTLAAISLYFVVVVRSEDARLARNFELYGTTTPERKDDEDEEADLHQGPGGGGGVGARGAGGAGAAAKKERHHPLAVAVFRSNLWEHPALADYRRGQQQQQRQQRPQGAAAAAAHSTSSLMLVGGGSQHRAATGRRANPTTTRPISAATAAGKPAGAPAPSTSSLYPPPTISN